MFAMSMGISIVDIISLSYTDNARENLKQKFDFANNNEKNIEDILEALEEIHIIDKALLSRQDNGINPVELLSQNEPVLISNEDGTKNYKTNFKKQRTLMDNYESQMINMFFKNNDEKYVKKHEQEFFNMLTTQELKDEFNQYRQDWYNSMKNQRQILSEIIESSENNDFLIKSKDQIKNLINNNALKREFDSILSELGYNPNKQEDNKTR